MYQSSRHTVGAEKGAALCTGVHGVDFQFQAQTAYSTGGTRNIALIERQCLPWGSLQVGLTKNPPNHNTASLPCRVIEQRGR